MPHDQLRNAIDSIRTQIQAELDAQLSAVERQHGEALELARQQARDEAEARWTAELARVNAAWESRLGAASAEAAADADRRVGAETARVRAEAEQQTADFVERAKRDAAQAFDQSRTELEQALQAERSGRAAAEDAHAARLAELEREIENAHVRADALEKELANLRAQQDEQVAASNRQVAALKEGRQAVEDRARRSADEAQSLRQSIEAESAARKEIEQQRQSLESNLSAARAEIEAQRQSFETERAAVRQEMEAAQAAARQAAEFRATTESRVAERQSQLAATERLLNAVQAISNARSLSDVLAALVNGASAAASRATVLVPAGNELQVFRAAGFDPNQLRQADPQDDVLRAAMKDRRAVPVTPAAAPAFAALLDDRAGLAVPITVGEHAVAVLYADNGLAESPEVPASWPEAVQILCQHASAAIAHLTAVRTTQAMRLMRPPASRPAPNGDADQSARRYARLLVSEIKLYNESAVRIGREKRDLLTRLRPEIERARRLYVERVPETVTDRARYFDQELRQTLADGDASLLGQQAVHP